MGVFKNEVGRPSNETIKKRNIFKILCFILIIIIILVIYILNIKSNDVKKNTDANQNNKTANEVIDEDIELNSKENKLSKEEVEDVFLPFNNVNNESTFFGYFYKEGKKSNNLDSDIIIFTALSNKKFNIGDKIESDSVKEYIYDIFGSNINYTDKTVEGMCEQYIYDSSSKKYTFDGGCSGDSARIISKIIDYKEENDKLIITNKILVEDFDFGGSGVDILYSDVNKKNIIEKVDVTKKEFNAEEEMDNYIDKLDSYKWTFIKYENGHYIFESVEKNN